jgi:hypothetical protein
LFGSWGERRWERERQEGRETTPKTPAVAAADAAAADVRRSTLALATCRLARLMKAM